MSEYFATKVITTGQADGMSWLYEGLLLASVSDTLKSSLLTLLALQPVNGLLLF